MFANGYFSHYDQHNTSPFDRMKSVGISYTSAGENLALAPNVNLAMQGLMNSPGHRANILSTSFHKVGIGVVDGGIRGGGAVDDGKLIDGRLIYGGGGVGGDGGQTEDKGAHGGPSWKFRIPE